MTDTTLFFGTLLKKIHSKRKPPRHEKKKEFVCEIRVKKKERVTSTVKIKMKRKRSEKG